MALGWRPGLGERMRPPDQVPGSERICQVVGGNRLVIAASAGTVPWVGWEGSETCGACCGAALALAW